MAVKWILKDKAFSFLKGNQLKFSRKSLKVATVHFCLSDESNFSAIFTL